MNRNHNTNGAQNQGWVTLNDQQLSHIEGGGELAIEELELAHEGIILLSRRAPPKTDPGMMRVLTGLI